MVHNVKTERNKEIKLLRVIGLIFEQKYNGIVRQAQVHMQNTETNS